MHEKCWQGANECINDAYPWEVNDLFFPLCFFHVFQAFLKLQGNFNLQETKPKGREG